MVQETQTQTQTESSLFLFLACDPPGLRLQEIERACDQAGDKKSISFPDLHSIN